jgi:hypothetical protein
MHPDNYLKTSLSPFCIVTKSLRSRLYTAFVGVAAVAIVIGAIESHAVAQGSANGKASLFVGTISDFVDEFRSEGWGAVDALNVTWLGDSPSRGTPTTPYRMPQAAEAIRMRNWMRYGDVGRDVWSDGVDSTYYARPIESDSALPYQIAEDRVGLAFGLGVLGRKSKLEVETDGGILDDLSWSTEVENRILGPKAGIVYQHKAGSWAFDLQALFLMGANIGQTHKSQSTNEVPIPGALNRSLFHQTTVYYSENESALGLSPVGELRAYASLRLTDHLYFRTDYSSFFVTEFIDNNGLISGKLPIVTFDVGRENTAVHSLFVGFDYSL